MHRKFWSALLSLAMIVSCFSGVALASGGASIGVPSQQFNSPNNVNLAITKADEDTMTVIVGSSGSVNFSGTAMAQGTESPIVYLNSANVKKLQQSITGSEGSGQLVFGELQGSTVYSANVLNSNTPNADLTGKYFYNRFVATRSDRLLTVDSDGRYSFSFIPEVHTTKYYGFALKDLVVIPANANDTVYGVFESSKNFDGTALNYDVEIANATAARNDIRDNNLPVVSALAGLKAEMQAIMDANDAIVNAMATLNSELAPLVATGTATQSEIDSVLAKFVLLFASLTNADNLLRTYSSGTIANTYLTNKTAIDTLIANFVAIGSVSNTAVVNALNAVSVRNDELYNHFSSIPFLQTRVLARGVDLTAAINEVYEEIEASGIAAANQLTLVGLVSDVQDALDAFEAQYFAPRPDTDMLENQFTHIIRKTTDGGVAGSTNYDAVAASLKELGDVALTAMNAYITSLTTANATLQSSNGTTKLPSERYLQVTPFRVQFKYKLRDTAPTYSSGTAGNHVINGTFVTAEGNVIPYDFDYEVYDDTYKSGQRIGWGRTQNGNFTVTINGIYTTNIVLYPVTKYNTSTNINDKLDLDDAAQKFSYTIATPSRRPFYKAELDQSVFTSNIARNEIIFKDLQTYNTGDSYDAKSFTNFTSRAAVVPYGVSYAVYSAATGGIALTKNYSVNNATYDVTWAWGWGGSTPDLLDSDSTSNTPAFYINPSTGALQFRTGAGTNANPYVYHDAYFEFASSGTLSMRTRVTGRQNNGTNVAENNELYQTILTAQIESPGQVTMTSGFELKEITPNNAFKFGLHVLDNSINSVRMTKISYDNKPNSKHELISGTATGAVDNTLTFAQNGQNFDIWFPWDMVKVGGSDIEIQLEFLEVTSSSTKVVTSKTVVIKNSLWKVTSERDIITVQQENTFSAVVVDQNDQEQNRASLYLFEGTNTVALAQNIIQNTVGGRYTFNRVRPTTGGDIQLYVYETDDKSPIKAMVTLQALGQADYTATLTEGKHQAVVGLAKTIEFTALNASGAAAADLIKVEIFDLDGAKSTDFKDYDKLQLVHASNGRYTVRLVGLTPGSYILRASTNNMLHYVDIEFEVLPLLIEYPEGFSILTWDTEHGKYSNFRDANKMSFTVKDPLTMNNVFVQIKSTDMKLIKADGEESEVGVTIATKGSTGNNNYASGGNVFISDKDFSAYNFNSNKDNHEFWVSVIDERSKSVFTAEGDLSLVFEFIVREGNSTGAENTVDGLIIPIGLPTVEANPTTVVRGIATTITLTVRDANGNPASGVSIRPDVENLIASPTNADGETQYLFTAVVTGNSKRFDISGYEYGNAQVFTIVNISDDDDAPVIALNPYVKETTNNQVTISGNFSDNIGLSKFAVDNTLVNMSLVGETSFDFSFTVDLKLGTNTFRMVLTDIAGQNTVMTIQVVRNEANVTILTLNSTEVISTDARVTGLDVTPRVVDGRTCLPIRFIFEAILGGSVDYADGVISAHAMGHSIVMTIGSNIAVIDGEDVALLTAPFIDAEAARALAPIREILTKIGVGVDFDATTGRIILTGSGDVDVIETENLIAPVGAIDNTEVVITGNTEDEEVDTDEVDTEDIDEVEDGEDDIIE